MIEAAGTAAAVDLAFRIARPRAQVLLKGLTTEPAVSVLPIVRKALAVTGQSGASERHYHVALEWLQQGLDAAACITHRLPLADGLRGFDIMGRCSGIVVFQS